MDNTRVPIKKSYAFTYKEWLGGHISLTDDSRAILVHSRNTKNQLKSFRSFKIVDGDILGYTKKGSRQIVARKGDRFNRKGYWGGHSKALREELKARPVKTRKNRKGSVKGFGLGLNLL